MISIKKIYKKEIPKLLEDQDFWNQSFLAISKHRLYAHYKNPSAVPDDVVLLLAYLDNELVGYMGVFIDKITFDNKESKIGWLSTWWVHPKTKGSGIGREILNTMYETQDGKIGISQFTPSAKRVYDKSGYFNTLKESKGVKAVLRSNLTFVVPALYSKAKVVAPFLNGIDTAVNVLVNAKLYVQKSNISKKLKNISLEYLNFVDHETMEIVSLYSKNHISTKTAIFFEWLKTYHWVQEAPLLALTDKENYEFSIYDKNFNIYLIKIKEDGRCIGLLVLQRRSKVCKILFAYYDKKLHAELVANIIKLQCIEQDVREIICYDEAITKAFSRSSTFLYRTNKIKQSIISKAFQKDDFEDVVVNFGDGDCSFA
jgi:hypothetical protein